MERTFIQHGPHGQPRRHSSPAPLRLEITRGRAKQLVRPIHSRVYLMGTAKDCDLVLGDLRFPSVHAYVLQGPEGPAIRWLGEGPELTVNGTPAVDAISLADDDLIRTGPYEFRLRTAEDASVGDACA